MIRRALFLTVAVAAAAGLAGCDKKPAATETAATGGSGAACQATAPARPANGDWSTAVGSSAECGIVMGNPDAKVKLVEYASLTCPHCAEFAAKGQQPLVDKYVKTGQVSYEFRNFVRDPLDITMSLIARCGGANPQFFKLTDAMYADQNSFFEKVQAVPQDQLAALQTAAPAQQFQSYAKFAGLQEWAAQRGVPSAKSGQCLSNQQEIDRLVQMNSEAATQYEIPGTPSFLIDGKLAEGAATWETLEPKIREALGG